MRGEYNKPSLTQCCLFYSAGDEEEESEEEDGEPVPTAVPIKQNGTVLGTSAVLWSSHHVARRVCLLCCIGWLCRIVVLAVKVESFRLGMCLIPGCKETEGLFVCRTLDFSDVWRV